MADAATAGDAAKLVDELGDLLFQVTFLSLLLEEQGRRRPRSRRPDGEREARAPSSARLRRRGGHDCRTREGALGGDQVRAGRTRGRLPRPARVAPGAAPRAQGAASRGDRRLRLARHERAPRQGARGARRARGRRRGGGGRGRPRPSPTPPSSPRSATCSSLPSTPHESSASTPSSRCARRRHGSSPGSRRPSGSRPIEASDGSSSTSTRRSATTSRRRRASRQPVAPDRPTV